MTTSFPSGLDALTNPTSSDGLNSPDHAGQHADLNDAVEALEAKVGVDGSAVTSSLDYMVAASKVVTDKVDPASASTNQVLKFNGTKFVPATGASVTVSDTPPTSPTPQAGDQWYESDSGRQLIYYDGFWVEIGSTATTNVNANDLSGTVLASNVVSSSLTSFGSSPILAGTPTAPTATAGTNTTQVATTAFVTTAAINAAPQITVYTSGSGTYTVPSNTRWLSIKLVGGGGGGAGSGGGSGAGNAGNGAAGGTSTFGTSLISATGGGGGRSSGQGASAAGSGTVSSPASGFVFGGTLGINTAQYNTARQVFTGGTGGPPTPLSAFGAGGANAGAGATAVCMGSTGSSAGYVEAIISSPSASYSYSVGAGGTGGAAGTSGFAGSAGGSGAIYITAWF